MIATSIKEYEDLIHVEECLIRKYKKALDFTYKVKINLLIDKFVGNHAILRNELSQLVKKIIAQEFPDTIISDYWDNCCTLDFLSFSKCKLCKNLEENKRAYWQAYSVIKNIDKRNEKYDENVHLYMRKLWACVPILEKIASLLDGVDVDIEHYPEDIDDLDVYTFQCFCCVKSD